VDIDFIFVNSYLIRRKFRNQPPNTRKSSALLPLRQRAPNHWFWIATPGFEDSKHPPNDADTDSNTRQLFGDKRQQFSSPGWARVPVIQGRPPKHFSNLFTEIRSRLKMTVRCAPI
jgi:hypothetical protein